MIQLALPTLGRQASYLFHKKGKNRIRANPQPLLPQCLATNSEDAEHKVAIVFYGLSRKLTSTYPYNKKNLLDVLTASNIAFDVFWHTLTANEISHVRSRENKAILDKFDMRVINPCVVEMSDNSFVRDKQFELFCKAHNLDPEEAIKTCTEKYPFKGSGGGSNNDPELKRRHKDCMSGYFDLYRDSYESLKNLLGAFHTLSRLSGVVEHHSKKRNITYDGIVVLRPDTAMVGAYIDLPAVIGKIQSKELRGVWTPDYMEMGGYNDRFAYGSFEDMLTYMHRGDHFRDTVLPVTITNSEMFLKHYLELHKIPHHTTSAKVVRVRANGRIDPSDCALFLGKRKQCKNCFAYSSDYANLQHKSKYKDCISATCELNGPGRC